MCCGPCSVIPLKRIMAGRAEVWGFFYNPNIHPFAEFKRRLDAVKTLAGFLSINIICDEAYRAKAFIKGLTTRRGARQPSKGERCPYCYETRLDETAKTAKEHGFDAFSSSLLYSRHQDHSGIIRAGKAASEANGVPFLYEDFRTGWQDGIDESRKMGLYRQNYCGCVYSMGERLSEKRERAILKKAGAKG